MGGSQHPDLGSGIRDEQPGSYFLELRNHFFAFFGVKILKFFDEDPGSEIQDGDSSDPGSEINIPDPPHWAAEIFLSMFGSNFCPPGSRSALRIRIRMRIHGVLS
jgi:hypothetical protein